MRIGQVIGKVTMSIQEEAFHGGRWLVVNPVDTEQINTCISQPPSLTKQASLIIYDNIGAREKETSLALSKEQKPPPPLMDQHRLTPSASPFLTRLNT